jgi:hypothetical protein
MEQWWLTLNQAEWENQFQRPSRVGIVKKPVRSIQYKGDAKAKMLL